MNELSRYLFLAGGLPFIVLGAAHAFHTPHHPDERKGLSTSDPALGQAMTRAHPLLTRRTDIWRAWVGFNLSHSLGAALFGAFVLVLGRDPSTFDANVTFALPLTIVTSLTYLFLGLHYWFKIPIAGCAISASCFAASAALRVLGI